MTTNTEKLGGRLPLLDPLTLSAAQKEIYDRINATFVSWSDRINFESATDDGRLIGPSIRFSSARKSRLAFWICTMRRKNKRR